MSRHAPPSTRPTRAPSSSRRRRPAPCAEPLEPRVLLATVSGYKYEDLDRDGTRDPGEPGLPGWVMYHDDDHDRRVDPAEEFTRTDADGHYVLSFPASTGLVGSIEWVREVPTRGWIPTSPSDGEDWFLLYDDSTRILENFGSTRVGYVAGSVFDDLDVDAARDAGEGLLGGWTVYADLDNDAILDSGEPGATSGGNGGYEFLLAPSDTPYVIRLVQRIGWAQTRPAIGYYSATVRHASTAFLDFGVTQRGVVSGAVFDDLDADTLRDSGEPGLVGWTVFAEQDSDGVLEPGETSTVTAADGSYSLSLVGSATPYVICAQRQSGWRPSLPLPQFIGYNVTVQPGSRRTLDFGNTTLGLITGHSVNDVDGDGARDAGEIGSPGQRIYVDLDNDSLFDANEPSRLTDAEGRYDLSVPSGSAPVTYTVRQLPQPGTRATNPLSGSRPATFTGPGQIQAGLDFLNTSRPIITGVMYEDLDADGVLDFTPSPGEPRLEGWTVYADLNNNQAPDAGEPSGLTDFAGNFRLLLDAFPDNHAATVYVREVPKPGWRQTAPDPAFTIANGQRIIRHFGNTRLGLIAGQVVHDENGDGARVGDAPLPGWTVYLDLDDDDAADASEPQASTDAQGGYRFAVRTDRAYAVREVFRDGFRASMPAADEYHLDFTATGETHAGLDFLNTRRPKVVGTVFNDSNLDRQYSSGDTGLAGWTVYHDANNNDALDDGETRALTGTDGAYVLAPPAPPGPGPVTYTIRQVLLSGWGQTFPAGGESVVSLGAGQSVGGVDFGNSTFARVRGRAFEDTDGDGALGSGERGIESLRVYLDANDNGVVDPGERSDFTDRDGAYSLPAFVPTRPIVIRQIPLPDWVATSHQDFRATLVPQRGIVYSVDFGNALPATVTGRAFHDLDVDGVNDPTEPGLGGTRVYLDDNRNGRFDDTAPPAAFEGPSDRPTTVNNQSIRSSIDVAGLLPTLRDLDVYVRIRHRTPSDLDVFLVSPRGTRVELFTGVGGTSDDIDVTLDDEAAVSIVAADPPLRQITVRPEGLLSAFDGEDPNGRWTLDVFDRFDRLGDTGGETGRLDQWQLLISGGEQNVLTAPDGSYSFSGLRPRPNLVIATDPTAPWFPTGAPRNLSLTSGARLSGINLGNAQPGSVSGVSFDDRDGDGARGPDEPGLAGRTIFRDLNNNATFESYRAQPAGAGVLVPDATTRREPSGVFVTAPGTATSQITVDGAAGLLLDLNVNVDIIHPRVSDLTLRLVSPSGREVRLADRPAGGANLTDTTFDDGADLPISLGSAPYAGRFRPAEGLSAFNDIDANGRWTLFVTDNVTGESGELRSWSMEIAHGEPSRVTDAAGAYRFDNMLPGQVHAIREVQQPGWQQTAPGGDGARRVGLYSGEQVTGRDFGNRRVARPQVLAVYARGSSWLGDDGIAANFTFKEYLEAGALGDRVYGYRLTGGETLPWSNVNQLVLVYDSELPERAPPASMAIDGIRSDYAAAPSVLGPRALLLTLDRPLGAQPAGGENGDRITLTDDLVAAGFQIRFNVLQGDADRGGSVLANDFSEVKMRFFRTATAPGPPGGTQYDVFHDVDGSGAIVGNDFSLVKARFFDALPAPSVAPRLFGDSPVLRPGAADLLASPDGLGLTLMRQRS